MWTLRDLMMMTIPGYKEKMMREAAERLRNNPVGNGYMIDDRVNYNLEDLFRMHPQRQMLMDQWDKMGAPAHNEAPTRDSLRYYMNQKPPNSVGML